MVVSPQAEEIIDYEAWTNGALGSKAIKNTDHCSSTISLTHAHTLTCTRNKSRRMSHFGNYIANFIPSPAALSKSVWQKGKEKVLAWK